MRTPFGSNNGGMLRTVHRSLRSDVGTSPTAPTSPVPNSPTKKSYMPVSGNLLSLSSFTQPLSPATWHSIDGEVLDWECVDGGDLGVRVCEDYVFGSVPGIDEVNQAVSALQRVVDSPSFSIIIKDRYGYSSDKDSLDGITNLTRITSPPRRLNGRELSPYGPDKVYKAFHLLQTEPCIQRMVVSLSTDKAVWDAVLNNKVVRELRETLSQVEGVVSKNLNGIPTEAAASLLSLIFDSTKAKLMEIIEKVTNLVNELFPIEEKTTKSTTGGEDVSKFVDKLRASFMLSIIVLLIVVVGRVHGA